MLIISIPIRLSRKSRWLKYDHWVLSRLVPCLKCTVLACSCSVLLGHFGLVYYLRYLSKNDDEKTLLLRGIWLILGKPIEENTITWIDTIWRKFIEENYHSKGAKLIISVFPSPWSLNFENWSHKCINCKKIFSLEESLQHKSLSVWNKILIKFQISIWSSLCCHHEN